jgi:hypothetical protein
MWATRTALRPASGAVWLYDDLFQEETMKIFSATVFVLLLLGGALMSASARQTSSPRLPEKPRHIKVFLVALGDNGKHGKKIGCDDSLVPVTRAIKPTSAVLKAALEELLSLPHQYDSRLQNYWRGENMKLKQVSLNRGVAIIEITGNGPFVAGVCDKPRIITQIEETAKQFPTIKKVSVFVNGRPLADAVS